MLPALAPAAPIPAAVIAPIPIEESVGSAGVAAATTSSRSFSSASWSLSGPESSTSLNSNSSSSASVSSNVSSASSGSVSPSDRGCPATRRQSSPSRCGKIGSPAESTSPPTGESAAIAASYSASAKAAASSSTPKETSLLCGFGAGDTADAGADGFTSSSSMMRRIEARISSMLGWDVEEGWSVMAPFGFSNHRAKRPNLTQVTRAEPQEQGMLLKSRTL